MDGYYVILKQLKKGTVTADNNYLVISDDGHTGMNGSHYQCGSIQDDSNS